MTPALVIRLTRRTDDAIVLHLRRADGRDVWQRREGPTAEFFAVHDLTHFAVETTLRCTRGFYGLVAAGWSLEDFGHPWPRGPLPPDAVAVEVLVGFLDTQRAAATRATAAEVNAAAEAYFASAEGHTLVVTDNDLSRIHSRLSQLVDSWRSMPRGESLELTFDPATFPSAPSALPHRRP